MSEYSVQRIFWGKCDLGCAVSLRIFIAINFNMPFCHTSFSVPLTRNVAEVHYS